METHDSRLGSLLVAWELIKSPRPSLPGFVARPSSACRL